MIVAMCILLVLLADGSHGVRKVVFDSVLADLQDKAMDSEAIKAVVTILHEKVNSTGDDCILVSSDGCELRLTDEDDRSARTTTGVKTYLKQLISKLALDNFPKMQEVVRGIFANDTTINDDLHAKLDLGSQMVILKTIQAVSANLKKVISFKAPFLIVASLIMTLVLMLVVYCVVQTCSNCVTKYKEVRQADCERYYRQRRSAMESEL